MATKHPARPRKGVQTGSPAGTPAEACVTRLLDVYPPLFRIAMRVYREHVPEGLTMTQFRALTYIARHGGCQVSEVAQAVDISASAASIAIARLVSGGLVRIAKRATDRRRAELWATRAGDARRARASAITRDQ